MQTGLKHMLTVAHVGAAIYGIATAIVAHAGLWEAADTWESLGIAAVATASTLMTRWVERKLDPDA